jgi:hypothetical protein
MARLRREIKAVLEQGTRCACKTTGGACAEILRVEESLWTFARVAGVPPTNNAAGSAERHAVIWRRISGDTDSESASRFVERMLTAVATCRQQGRGALVYLSSCLQAAGSGQAIPSLLPVTQFGNQSRLIPAIPPYDPLHRREAVTSCSEVFSLPSLVGSLIPLPR